MCEEFRARVLYLKRVYSELAETEDKIQGNKNVNIECRVPMNGNS